MKKMLLLSALTALLFCGCGKYCSCTNPDTQNVNEIEVNYNDDCQSYSNNNRGDCI